MKLTLSSEETHSVSVIALRLDWLSYDEAIRFLDRRGYLTKNVRRVVSALYSRYPDDAEAHQVAADYRAWVRTL